MALIGPWSLSVKQESSPKPLVQEAEEGLAAGLPEACRGIPASLAFKGV